MNILLAGFSYPYGASSIRITIRYGDIVKGTIRNYNIDNHGICAEDLPFIDSPEVCEKLLMYRYPHAYHRDFEDVVPEGEPPSMSVMYMLKRLLENSEIYNALIDVYTEDEVYEGLHPNHIDIINLGGSRKLLLGGDVDEIILPEELLDIKSNKEYFTKTRNDIIGFLNNHAEEAAKAVPNDPKMFGVSKESLAQLKAALRNKPKRKLRKVQERRAMPQEEPDFIEPSPRPEEIRQTLGYYTYRNSFDTSSSASYTVSTGTYTDGFKITEG